MSRAYRSYRGVPGWFIERAEEGDTSFSGPNQLWAGPYDLKSEADQAIRHHREHWDTLPWNIEVPEGDRRERMQ